MSPQVLPKAPGWVRTPQVCEGIETPGGRARVPLSSELRKNLCEFKSCHNPGGGVTGSERYFKVMPPPQKPRECTGRERLETSLTSQVRGGRRGRASAVTVSMLITVFLCLSSYLVHCTSGYLIPEKKRVFH